MDLALKWLTKRPRKLKEVIPAEVAWFSFEIVVELLKISPSQLKRDTSVLQSLYPQGWEKVPYSRGYSRNTVEVLWEFRQLVRERGRPEAINQINQHMEDFWNERE